MTKDEHIKYWLEAASHDLETAKALFESEKYDWCLFISHLDLEKTLKAYFVKKNDNKFPPKIHNLVKLADLSNHEMDEDKRILFDRINDFNILKIYYV